MRPKSDLRIFGGVIASLALLLAGLVYFALGFIPYFALGAAAAVLLLTALRPETLVIPYELWSRLRHRG